MQEFLDNYILFTADVLDSSIESEKGSETCGDLLDEIKRLEDEPVTLGSENPEKCDETKTEVSADLSNTNKTNELPKPTFNIGDKLDSDVSDINSNESKAAYVGQSTNPSTRRLIMEKLKSTHALMEGAEFTDISTSGLVGIQGVLNELMSKVNMAMIAKCPMSPSSSQADD